MISCILTAGYWKIWIGFRGLFVCLFEFLDLGVEVFRIREVCWPGNIMTHEVN